MDENQKLDEIIRKLGELDGRLLALEGRGTGSFAPSASSLPPLPPPYQRPDYQAQSLSRPQPYRAEFGEAMGASSEQISAVPEKAGQNYESTIGKWWFGVIGVLAILFGVAFFLKYAFENNLISETMRVVLGIAGGVLFVALGEFLRPRLAKYSYILSGGGLALFYLSIYAAFQYYHLISQPTAFVAMIAVTIFGTVLSLWVDAVELAALSAAGGFLTPFLVSTGASNDFSFFSYLIVLNLGIVAVAFFKKWHQLVILGFAATILNFASWYGGFYDGSKLHFAIYILTIFYGLYLIAGLASNIVARKLADMGDLFVLSVNPAWYFGWLYFLIKSHPSHLMMDMGNGVNTPWIVQYSDQTLGFLAAILAGVYIVCAYLAVAVRSDDKRLVMFLGGVAVVFLTIAVPLILDQNAITIAWAVEAAVLFVLGIFLKNRDMRIFAICVYIVALVRLFGFDSSAGDLSSYVAIFNKRFFTYFIVIATVLGMGYIASKKKEELTAFERGDHMPTLFWTVGNFLIFLLIILEINSFFDSRIYALQVKLEKEIQRQIPVRNQSDPYYAYQDTYGIQYQAQTRLSADAGYRRLNNLRNAAISVFLTLYAIILMAIGVLYRNKYVRWSSVVLFGVTIVKVFFFDLTVLAAPQRIISFIVLGIILLFASYLYFRFEKRLEASQ